MCPGDGGADGGRGAADFVDEGVVRRRGGDDGEESHSEGVSGRIRTGDAVSTMLDGGYWAEGAIGMRYIERKTCWMRSFLDMPLSIWACIMS